MQCGKILETPESVVKVPLVAEEHSSCTVGGRGHSSRTVGGRGTQFPHRWWQHSSCTVGGREHSSCTVGGNTVPAPLVAGDTVPAPPNIEIQCVLRPQIS